MRKANSLEIVGLGKFDFFTIKAEMPEFLPITKEGKPLQQVKQPSIPRAKAVWIDDAGIEYNEEKVFFNVFGVVGQKFKKTEKVPKWSIVDRMEYDNLAEQETYTLKCDETTLMNFNEKIGDKAVKFNWKKSSMGKKWSKAFLLKMYGKLVVIAGLGDRKKAIEETETITEIKTIEIRQIVEISADAIEIEI